MDTLYPPTGSGGVFLPHVLRLGGMVARWGRGVLWQRLQRRRWVAAHRKLLCRRPCRRHVGSADRPKVALNRPEWGMKLGFNNDRASTVQQVQHGDWGKGSMTSVKTIVWLLKCTREKPAQAKTSRLSLQGGNMVTVCLLGQVQRRNNTKHKRVQNWPKYSLWGQSRQK